MAYEVKYRGEFTDYQDTDWKVEILEDGFSGSITTMVFTGEPVIVEWPSTSDDLFEQNIRGSQATINVYAETSFQYSDLYTSDNLEYQVNIYYDSTLYWTGWVMANNWEEDYAQPPYPVVIKAVDGLGLLKDFDFSDTSLTGRLSASEIIYEIISLISWDEFTEYINVYDDVTLSTVDDSPLLTTSIDCDLFEENNCYDVLVSILLVFNAAITQYAGDLIIYRYLELKDSTMYGRTFTDADTISSTTNSPDQYINRTTSASNYFEAGGHRMITPQVDILTINQSFGYKDSWLNNWEIKANTFSTGTFEDWTRGDGCEAETIYRDIGDGMDNLTRNTYPTLTKCIYQNFATNAVESTTDIYRIEFEWSTYNATGSAIGPVTFYVEVKSTTENQYLYKSAGSACSWATSQAYIELTDTILPGRSEWYKFSRYFIGLPAPGPYRISIFGPDSATTNAFQAIRNIKIYATSDEITTLSSFYPPNTKFLLGGLYAYQDNPEVMGKQYTVDNSTAGELKEISYNMGDVTNADVGIDNILEQFTGALGRLILSLTAVANRFVAEHAADYTSGGVVVTSTDNYIYFTSATPGVDFTGSTTITNTSGDLSGSVDALTGNLTALARIDTVTLTGASGRAGITCDGVTRIAIWDTDLTTTASNFVFNHAAAYAIGGVTVTSSGADIIFTSDTAGVDFTGDTTIVNNTGDLDGSVANTQANRVAVARVDRVTLTGTTGTADILCDGVTEEASWAAGYSEAWSTRGGSESDPIIELVGGEIGNQFSRPKDLLDLTIYERNDAFLNRIGNLQDDLNQYSGSNRVFAINGATYNIRERIWDLSLNELI